KVEKNKEEIKGFKLNQNYPNPFNPTTTISYDLPGEASVEVKIYDIIGNEVRTFSFNSQTSGYHNLMWDGRNSYNQTVSSGTYIYRLKAVSAEGRKTFERSSKMLLLK
ncbi:MAG: FlgD immunoglobulin-like domain containing protein, partial [Bacteroidota bacterium]|nr:FlgD immunoglobulin-like domain containing protein [Bacteroidota bacterium]